MMVMMVMMVMVMVFALVLMTRRSKCLVLIGASAGREWGVVGIGGGGRKGDFRRKLQKPKQ